MTIWIEPGSQGSSITITNTWPTHIAKASDVTSAPWGWDGDGAPVTDDVAEVANG